MELTDAETGGGIRTNNATMRGDLAEIEEGSMVKSLDGVKWRSRLIEEGNALKLAAGLDAKIDLDRKSDAVDAERTLSGNN